MSKIRPIFRCNEVVKQKFRESKCLLTISVGQETHEQDRLATTLELIGKSFSSCVIALNDGLQRYTMALEHRETTQDLHGLAIELGDAWLKRNEEILSKNNLLLKILRWSDFLEDPDFEGHKNNILKELQDPTYRTTFDESMLAYLDRYRRRIERPDLFDVEKAKAFCLEYLVEECATICLWPKTGCQFEMYTGKHNAAMQKTKKRFALDGMPQSIVIGFNRRPNLKPQNFKLRSLSRDLAAKCVME